MTTLTMVVCIMVCVIMAALGITAGVAYHMYVTNDDVVTKQRKEMITWLEEREV